MLELKPDLILSDKSKRGWSWLDSVQVLASSDKCDTICSDRSNRIGGLEPAGVGWTDLDVAGLLAIPYNYGQVRHYLHYLH